MPLFHFTILAMCASGFLSTASAQDLPAPTPPHDHHIMGQTLTTPLISAKPPCPLSAPKGGCAHKPRC